MSRSQSETGNAFREAPPQDLRQSRNEQHFQPEAGNEVLKGFELKLTPMRFASQPTIFLQHFSQEGSLQDYRDFFRNKI
ncbi:hypothetical protein [Nostoc sp.]|uniref:hypothetical protein n=1 Tax=Nostoc sp. TaxID=1180 RepID=UPI002FF6EC8C